jgi:hypothetical protein
MNVTEVRSQIRARAAEYLALDGYPYNLHFNQFPGAGKTTIILDECEKANANFVYLMDNHDNVTDQMGKQPALFDCTHIESKERLCHEDTYKDLSKKCHISIKHFCRECSYYYECEYYARMREIYTEPTKWAGVHSHLGFLVKHYVDTMQSKTNPIDVVIIDEYPDALIRKTPIRLGALKSTEEILFVMADSAEKTLITDILLQFEFAFQHKSLKEKAVNAKEVFRLIWYYFNRKGNAKNLEIFSYEFENKLIERYRIWKRAIPNIMTGLCEAIATIGKFKVPSSSEEIIKYVSNMFYSYFPSDDENGYSKEFVIEIWNFDPDVLDINAKVIILDATTYTNYYQRLFNRTVQPVSHNIALNKSFVYQCSSAKFVMETLDNENEKTKSRLFNIIKMIAEKHNQPILVVSRKRYEDEIKDIHPLIRTTHYGVKGTNAFEDINVGVLFGTPELPKHIVERESEVLGIHDYNAVLAVKRESLMIQAIHRIRISLKLEQATWIYLLTKLNIGFVNAKNLSLSGFEHMLALKSGGCISEELNDDIRCNITELLTNPLTQSEIIEQIPHNRNLIIQILKEMEQSDLIRKMKGTNQKGRKRNVYALTED